MWRAPPASSLHDAAAVVEELEKLKVSYELTEGGTKVLVPKSQVHEVRVKLQGSGMPLAGGSGFELFDDSDFGMTEFAQRINFQRAMQGELSRTIGSMPEIKTARVHLVLPDSSLFGRKQELATAAVTISTAGNIDLRKIQVRGIQRLVAASVEGLEEGMVTVIDERGVTLSRPATNEGDVESVSSRLEKKQEVESYLVDKANAVLTRVLGPGAAVVSVDASLRMDTVKKTLQKVVTREDGSGWVKMRRETRNWTGLEEEGGDGGVTTETQYDLGHSIEEVVAMPGAIERLSVGVLIPGPIEESEVKKIEDVVAMAVGFSPNRGDSIAVRVVESASIAGGDFALETSTGEAGGVDPMLELEAAMEAEGSLASRISPKPRAASLPPTTAMLGGFEMGAGVIGIVVIATLLTAVLIIQLRSQTQKPKTLTATEREQVLQRLHRWLDDDKTRADESPL